MLLRLLTTTTTLFNNCKFHFHVIAIALFVSRITPVVSALNSKADLCICFSWPGEKLLLC